MKDTKTFPLGVVLSATTGRLLCNMDEIYCILNHVTGDNLFTHALPRAFRFAGPLIKLEHPELKTAEKSENLAKLDRLIAGARTRNESLAAPINLWLAELSLCKEYAITSHADAWLIRDPIEELQAMVSKDKVITVLT